MLNEISNKTNSGIVPAKEISTKSMGGLTNSRVTYLDSRVRRSAIIQFTDANGIASRALPLHFRLQRGAVAGRRHVVANSRPRRRSDAGEGRRRRKGGSAHAGG